MEPLYPIRNGINIPVYAFWESHPSYKKILKKEFYVSLKYVINSSVRFIQIFRCNLVFIKTVNVKKGGHKRMFIPWSVLNVNNKIKI